MNKHEYITIEAFLPIKTETLDEMSKDGWELVTITTLTNLDEKKYISYFKRWAFK